MSMMKKSACIWNSSVKNLKIKTQCVILNARWFWFALGGMLLYPFAVVVASLADLDNAQKTLGDMAPTYFVAVAGIVAAFFGPQAFTKK